MEPDARKAYQSWKAQRQRCYNPNNEKHKHYKGLEVEYSSRDFITWWLNEISKKEYTDPTCGRLDHSKSYRFDNIRIEERTDNTRERNSRCRFTKSRRILCSGPGGDMAEFYSIGSAAKFTGIPRSTIHRSLTTGKKVKNLLFEYID